MSTAMIAATVGGYAAVLAATFLGLMTLVSGIVSTPLMMIYGKITAASKRRRDLRRPGPVLFIIPMCVNVLLWLGVGAL